MTHSDLWQPTASIASLRTRAKVLHTIRQFFAQRKVLEVETPILSHGSVTDVHLRAFTTHFINPLAPERETLYLQTSPEFAMKRLLCAGSGCIFQICKAFRNEEAGRFHNPEFTMLEWYRIDFDHWQLLAEVDALLRVILNTPAIEIMTYQQAFIRYCDIDPLAANVAQIQHRACELGYQQIADTESSKDVLLQLLCSEVIERQIGETGPVALVNFPASQAALARLEPDDVRIARRFEVYYKGIELANGYHELCDPQEQLLRFERDNQVRESKGLPTVKIDDQFIQAMRNNLPNCAGVALGIDRLLMLVSKFARIDDVLSFSIKNA
jgi:lysyl-tRNA synthetase class 2